MWTGSLVRIHFSPRSGVPMQQRDCAELIAGAGIAGDRYADQKGKFSRSRCPRDISLIDYDALQRIKDKHGIDLGAGQHRRNLTTRGVPLIELVGKTFQIGNTVLEGIQLCGTCRYLNLMAKAPISLHLQQSSGILCSVLSGGIISVGDQILPK